jgi:hypothetical protein
MSGLLQSVIVSLRRQTARRQVPVRPVDVSRGHPRRRGCPDANSVNEALHAFCSGLARFNETVGMIQATPSSPAT